jgi:hypothetical protein
MLFFLHMSVHFVSLSSPLQDGPLAEALGAWKAEPKTTYQALQQPISAENEEKVKQQAMEIHGDGGKWCTKSILNATCAKDATGKVH